MAILISYFYYLWLLPFSSLCFFFCQLHTTYFLIVIVIVVIIVVILTILQTRIMIPISPSTHIYVICIHIYLSIYIYIYIHRYRDRYGGFLNMGDPQVTIGFNTKSSMTTGWFEVPPAIRKRPFFSSLCFRASSPGRACWRWWPRSPSLSQSSNFRMLVLAIWCYAWQKGKTKRHRNWVIAKRERERVLDFLFCLIVPSWLSQSQAACKKGNYNPSLHKRVIIFCEKLFDVFCELHCSYFRIFLAASANLQGPCQVQMLAMPKLGRWAKDLLLHPRQFDTWTGTKPLWDTFLHMFIYSWGDNSVLFWHWTCRRMCQSCCVPGIWTYLNCDVGWYAVSSCSLLRSNDTKHAAETYKWPELD